MTSNATPMVNDKREIFGWAMFDWANSAFSTTVVTVFLGPYLSSITKAAADANGMVYLLGVPIRYDSYFTYLISASVLLQVTFLPILGALADYSLEQFLQAGNSEFLNWMVLLGAVGNVKAAETFYMPDHVATGWGFASWKL